MMGSAALIDADMPIFVPWVMGKSDRQAGKLLLDPLVLETRHHDNLSRPRLYKEAGRFSDNRLSVHAHAQLVESKPF